MGKSFTFAYYCASKKSWLCKLSSEFVVTDEYWLTNSILAY